jgi:hypothetical protein
VLDYEEQVSQSSAKQVHRAFTMHVIVLEVSLGLQHVEHTAIHHKQYERKHSALSSESAASYMQPSPHMNLPCPCFLAD